MYITVKDIVSRLLPRKPHWAHGKPSITVDGQRGQFGVLSFDFQDEVVSFGVYLHVEADVILRLASLAIIVFPEMAQRIHDWEVETWAAYNR